MELSLMLNVYVIAWSVELPMLTVNWGTVVILHMANKCTVCISVLNRRPTDKLLDKSVNTS